MNYQDLRNLFRRHESGGPKTHLTACITFTAGSFASAANYSEQERTYEISSSNKAFQPGMGGYSIFGSCLDRKTDPCLRLDRYMAEEHGGKDGWIIEDCCLIAYLLVGSNERDFLQPQLFYSHEEAAETMLWELCRAGSRSYEDAKAEFDKQGGVITSDSFEVSHDSAWLNDSPVGNWDWQIYTVRISDPQHIAIGYMGNDLSPVLENDTAGAAVSAGEEDRR